MNVWVGFRPSRNCIVKTEQKSTRRSLPGLALRVDRSRRRHRSAPFRIQVLDKVHKELDLLEGLDRLQAPPAPDYANDFLEEVHRRVAHRHRRSVVLRHRNCRRRRRGRGHARPTATHTLLLPPAQPELQHPAARHEPRAPDTAPAVRQHRRSLESILPNHPVELPVELLCRKRVEALRRREAQDVQPELVRDRAVLRPRRAEERELRVIKAADDALDTQVSDSS